MKYAKFVVAAVSAGLVALGSALSDDKIVRAEWVVIALAALGAVGVFVVPNKPDVTPPAAGVLRREVP